jgi:hypothetical protein
MPIILDLLITACSSAIPVTLTFGVSMWNTSSQGSRLTALLKARNEEERQDTRQVTELLQGIEERVIKLECAVRKMEADIDNGVPKSVFRKWWQAG